MGGSVGKIEYATMLKNDWGQPKGAACVRFATEDDAKRAVDAFNGTDFQDRALKVEPWTGPMPQTNKYWDNLLEYFAGPAKLKFCKGPDDQMVYVTGIKMSVKYDVL